MHNMAVSHALYGYMAVWAIGLYRLYAYMSTWLLVLRNRAVSHAQQQAHHNTTCRMV